MEEKIKETLGKIMSKAYEINKNTKHNLFLDYSGHVDVLDIHYCKNGWSETAEKMEEIRRIRLKEKYAYQQLERVLKQLEEIEEESKCLEEN